MFSARSRGHSNDIMSLFSQGLVWILSFRELPEEGQKIPFRRTRHLVSHATMINVATLNSGKLAAVKLQSMAQNPCTIWATWLQIGNQPLPAIISDYSVPDDRKIPY